MHERKVLGRGLQSLIPTLPARPEEAAEGTPRRWASPTAGSDLKEIPTSSIYANPRQPRRHFSETALEELSQSIRRAGILQPVVVRRTERGYELISGERRLRAAKRAGLEMIPVVIREVTEQEQLELALIENLQREDLNPVEEAQGYDRLAREFSLTQEEIALRVGKERSTVSNMLRLLKLTSSVQEMLGTGTLSIGHARALLPLEDPRRQEELARRIEKEGLSVRQVEGLVRTMLARPARELRRMSDEGKGTTNLRHMSEELQRSLGTRVEVVQRGKGGEIRIQYYTSDDLQRLTNRLLSGNGKGTA